MLRGYGPEAPAGGPVSAGPGVRGRPPRGCGETGFITIQVVAAVGFSLVLLTLLANVVVFEYGRAVVRAALDEGVRMGSRALATERDCLSRIHSTIGDLIVAMADEVEVSCQDKGDRVEARAIASFEAWIPALPAWRFTSEATAVKEHVPGGAGGPGGRAR